MGYSKQEDAILHTRLHSTLSIPKTDWIIILNNKIKKEEKLENEKLKKKKYKNKITNDEMIIFLW